MKTQKNILVKRAENSLHMYLLSDYTLEFTQVSFFGLMQKPLLSFYTYRTATVVAF